MSAQELTFVLAHSDAALVVTHAGHAAHLRGCLPRRAAAARHRGAEGALPAGRAMPPAAAPARLSLLYTSGTTGTPKGCILTNEYFLEVGRLYTALGGYCRFANASDRLATPLPVTHMNALGVSFMAMLMTGGCLVQLDRFHPSTWWHSLRTGRATAFHYLGVMPAHAAQGAPLGAADHCRQARCASASARESIRGITRRSRRDLACRSSRHGR